MKAKFSITIFIFCFSIWSVSGNAQTTIPKGKAQLIEFTNANAKFTVPPGKAWYINQVFSYSVIKDEGAREYFSIYIKSINGKELTNFAVGKFGPIVDGGQFFGIQFPIIFPEKTTFELLVAKYVNVSQTRKNFSLSNQIAYINYVEVDN